MKGRQLFHGAVSAALGGVLLYFASGGGEGLREIGEAMLGSVLLYDALVWALLITKD